MNLSTGNAAGGGDLDSSAEESNEVDSPSPSPLESSPNESPGLEFDDDDTQTVFGEDDGVSQVGLNGKKKKKKKGVFGGLKVPKAFKGGKSKSSKSHKSDKGGSSAAGPEDIESMAQFSDEALSVPVLHSAAAARLSGSNLSGDIPTLHLKIVELDQQIVNLEREVDSLNEIIEQKDITIGVLKTEVEQLEQKITTLAPGSTSPTRSGKLDELAERLQSLVTQLGQEQMERARLSKELLMTQDELAEVRNNAEQEMERYQAQIAALNDELTAIKSKMIADQQAMSDQAPEHVLGSARSSAEQVKVQLEKVKLQYDEETDALQQRIDRLEAEKREQTVELRAHDAKLREAEEALKLLADQKGQVEHENRHLQQSIATLKATLDDKESAIKCVEANLSEEALQIQALTQENKQLEDRITSLSRNSDEGQQHLIREAAEARAAEAVASTELARVIKRGEGLETSLREAQTELSTLKDQLSALESAKSVFLESQSRTERDSALERHRLQDENVTLGADLADARAALVEAKTKIESLQGQVATLRNEAAVLECAKRETEEALAQLEVRTMDAGKQSQEKSAFWESRLREVEQERDESRAGKRQLATKLSEAEFECQKVKNELEMNQMKNDVLNATMTELQKQVKGLSQRENETSTAMTAKEGALQRQILDLTSTRDLQKIQLEACQAREADLRKAVAEAKKEATDLSAEVVTLKKAASGMEVEVSVLQKRLGDAVQENQQLKDLNDDLKKSSTSVLQDTLKNSQQITVEVSSLRLNVQQLERQNQDLQREIQTLNQRLMNSEVNQTDVKNQLNKANQQLRDSESRLAAADTQVKALKVSLQETYQREQQLQDELQAQRKSEKLMRRMQTMRDANDSFASGERPIETSEEMEESESQIREPPAAIVFSNVIANVPGESITTVVRTPDGSHEIVWCLKQRLVECLFENVGKIRNRSDVFNWTKGKASMKKAEELPEVARVLHRVRQLWKLGEDLRLALVQGDATLASVYQETTTTNADWEGVLETLRGSAEIIEARNAELEQVAASYVTALEESRTSAKADRAKAKNIVNLLKSKLESTSQKKAALESERDVLLKQIKLLEGQVQEYVTTLKRESEIQPASGPVAAATAPIRILPSAPPSLPKADLNPPPSYLMPPPTMVRSPALTSPVGPSLTVPVAVPLRTVTSPIRRNVWR